MNSEFAKNTETKWYPVKNELLKTVKRALQQAHKSYPIMSITTKQYVLTVHSGYDRAPQYYSNKNNFNLFPN